MSQMKKMKEIYPDNLLSDGMNDKYTLDHDIDDPNLIKAVMYACKLINEDKRTINEAVMISGKRYKKDITDIRLNLPGDICENAPSEDGADYRLYVDISVKKCFKLVAVILSDHNMCCCGTGAPYLLTKISYEDGHDIYSCQCSCDGWCTNGHDNPNDAIREYESMCERYIKRQRKKA